MHATEFEKFMKYFSWSSSVIVSQAGSYLRCTSPNGTSGANKYPAHLNS